ncbi:MFS transporter [Rhodococcus sp. 2H158]
MAVTTIEGIDLIMYGAVLPTLLETKQWGLTASSAGLIGALSLFGMCFGAPFAGYFADLIGRRPVVLTAIASFTVATLLCGFAPSLGLFGLFRFLAGVGFGAALPTVIALTMEYVRVERRQQYSGIIHTGVPLGGIIASSLALFVVPAWGWQHMFIIGGALGIVGFVIAFLVIPESMAFLAGKGRHEEARAIAARYNIDVRAESAISLTKDDEVSSNRSHAIKLLMSSRYRVGAILFPLICFCGLLASYGMNTWFPQMLRESGYNLGSALVFFIAFNVGTIAGMIIMGGLADRIGSRLVISTGFLVGAVTAVAVTFQPPQAVVLALVIVVGFCAAAQSSVSGFIGVYFPAEARGTALGLSLGLGRLGGVAGPIIVGYVLGSSLGVSWAFYALAAFGVLAALMVTVVPRSKGVTASSASPHVESGTTSRLEAPAMD